MNRNCTLPNDTTKQIDKFKEMAKELECDESEKAFDKKLGGLVREKDLDR